MHDRCEDANHNHYHRYGGRGIKVCDRWSGDGGFENFYADMGDPPFKGATIERKDNDGPYSPENCVWATQTAQARNKSNNYLVEYNGERITLVELSERTAVPYQALRARIAEYGWSVEESITRPLRRW